jgi:FMN-dependent NADH-azoreductase
LSFKKEKQKMTNVLHIIPSPRGSESLTRKLGNSIIEKLKEQQTDVVVKEHDLSLTPYPHLEEAHLGGFFLPEEQKTEAHRDAIKNSNEAIAELQEADVIVIGVPMYNFSIPSGLKAYFDHIARAKLTFQYTENGAEGLLKNKKAYIAASSAGVYEGGVMQAFDFAVPYVKHFLSFIGITDVTVFRVEGTAIPGLAETAFEKAIVQVEEVLGSAAVVSL